MQINKASEMNENEFENLHLWSIQKPHLHNTKPFPNKSLNVYIYFML